MQEPLEQPWHLRRQSRLWAQLSQRVAQPARFPRHISGHRRQDLQKAASMASWRLAARGGVVRQAEAVLEALAQPPPQGSL